jgi:hypothetical protein
MNDERPLIEGIEAYHESLEEGAMRERERILKLIDEKMDRGINKEMTTFDERQKEIASHVMEKYSLTYPCGCGYFIDSISEGNFFCPVHADSVNVAYTIIKRQKKE